MRAIKFLALASTILLGTTAANATDFTFIKTTMTSPAVVHVKKTGVIDENVYLGQMDFTTNTAMTLGAFCADLGHAITLGAQSPALVYHIEDLATFASISEADAQRIAWLSDTYLNSTLFNQEAAQGGIWEILGAVVTTSDTALKTQIDLFGASTSKVTYHPGIMTDDQHQGFVHGAVPEPASWAMMAVGFGLLGAMMRSRKSARVTFA